MSINIDYTPIRAVADLATQAGNAEAQQRQEAQEQQTAMAKMAHDDAMERMERQAQIQADAQFREQHFQKALKGDEFQQHLLTLQEQYGWNLKLDRAKADINLQSQIQSYQRKKQETDAVAERIRNEYGKTIKPEQGEPIIMEMYAQLATGHTIPAAAFKSGASQYRPHYATEEIGGVRYNVSYDTEGKSKVLGVAGTQQGQLTDNQILINIRKLEARKDNIASDKVFFENDADKNKELSDISNEIDYWNSQMQNQSPKGVSPQGNTKSGKPDPLGIL